ncbi:MAG: hypothetical protein ACRC53_09530 [Plesiomonas sp.]|uniref:hypothetical protein n=1 Tax=Plesiomonas sp. TaxID=2486279 RepID=UPI003F2DBE0E
MASSHDHEELIVTPSLLQQAVTEGLLTDPQRTALWHYLGQHAASTSRFTFSQVLYVLGGLLAIGAMTLFMRLSWSYYGPLTFSSLSALYVVIAALLTEHLHRRCITIPAALCAILVIVTVPIVLYGVQVHFGWWHQRTALPFLMIGRIDQRWLSLELSMVFTSALLLWRYRYPVLMLPLSLAIGGLLLDSALHLLDGWQTYLPRQYTVSLIIGLGMLLVAFWLDFRYRRTPDYAEWWYITGTTISWISLTLLDNNNELGRFLYFLINVTIMFTGSWLNRRVFTLFGMLGVTIYIGYLAWSLFAGSMAFPFILCGIGLLVIMLGVKWQRHEARIADWLQQHLPAHWRP